MSDVMSVRLHLSGVRVRGVLVDSVDRLEVEVESTREWSRCRHCGFRCYRVWDRRPKRVRDLEVSGRRTTLVWRRRRFWCGNCGERHLEDHDQFRAGLTRRLARRLVRDARVMSIRAVARHHGVGWHRIMGLVRAGPLCTRCPSPWPGMGGRCNSIVNRVVRSTSVPIAELRSPRIRSPSQWPGTARSSASAGRSLIMISGLTKVRPRCRVRAGPRDPQRSPGSQTRHEFPF